MSIRKTQKAPLWRRALNDPEVKKFLADHSDEFSPEHFIPQPVEFKDRIVLGKGKIIAVIQDGMPFPDVQHQETAKLMLEYTPAEMVKLLGIPRHEVYKRIKSLKNYARRRWKRRRNVLMNGWSRKPRLECEPEIAAIKTRVFTRGETTETVYLVQRDDDMFWVNASGRRLLEEIQEVLNELDLHEGEFEVLEVQR